MQRSLVAFFALAALACLLSARGASAAESLHLHTRGREKVADKPNEFEIVDRQVAWDPQQTAIVICDMWDRHWCQGATRRMAEMAPQMNEVVDLARRQGVLIIHCPSSCMKLYKDTPERKLAQQAPKVETKVPLVREVVQDRSGQRAANCRSTIRTAAAIASRNARKPRSSLDAGRSPRSTFATGDAITDNDEAFY